MFFDFIENVFFEWFELFWWAIAFGIGIIINIILWIYDFIKKDKQVKEKVRFLRFVTILFIPCVWFFCFFGYGIGSLAEDYANDLDYSYSYSNEFDAKEIKRMDYDIYLKENGDIHVKQVIQMNFLKDQIG